MSNLYLVHQLVVLPLIFTGIFRLVHEDEANEYEAREHEDYHELETKGEPGVMSNEVDWEGVWGVAPTKKSSVVKIGWLGRLV